MGFLYIEGNELVSRRLDMQRLPERKLQKREACHRCAYPKYGGPDPSTYSYNKTEALAGDWYCTTVSCGAHNYASRPNCFRCGAFKSVYPGDYGAYMIGSDQYGSDASIPPGWKSGDWICPRYTQNNNKLYS